jgi:hypothetical protein
MKPSEYIAILENDLDQMLGAADSYRVQEIRNLQAVITVIKEEVNLIMGVLEDSIDDLNEVSKRIKFLKDNPSHAGGHEQFKLN